MSAAMTKSKLRTWRLSEGLTLAAAARRFGLDGRNPASTLAKIESGQHRPSVALSEVIVRETGGAVTVQDLHDAALAWIGAKARARAGHGVAGGTSAEGISGL